MQKLWIKLIISAVHLKGQSDFVTYIKMLNDLAKLLNQKNGYAVYAGVVKNWIIGFKVMFVVIP